VRALLEAGLSGAAIARRLGITKSTVSYHKRRLGGLARETFMDAVARGVLELEELSEAA
jgi:hypothetical protein